MSQVAEVSAQEALRALDPGLPLLAARAAIELDSLLRKQTTGLEATKGLALRLSRSFEGAQEGPGPHFLVDPPTETLVTRAFRQAHWAGSVQTVSELATEASKLAASLQNTTKDSDPKTLEDARAFCAALAESAALYGHSQRSQLPMHPFRR